MGTKSELVDGKESAILFKDEVYAIIGAAFDVYKELGSGFLEAVYNEAMEIELAGRSIPFVSRTRLHVRFKVKSSRRSTRPTSFATMLFSLRSRRRRR